MGQIAERSMRWFIEMMERASSLIPLYALRREGRIVGTT